MRCFDSSCILVFFLSVGAICSTLSVEQGRAAGNGSPSPGEGAISRDSPALPCSLEISTEPAGASVLLNGRASGETPLVIPGLMPGKHIVVLQKRGYYQKKATIEVSQQPKTSAHFRLLSPGKLIVTSEPSGAAVRIDDTRRGTTPYADSLVKPGTYTVTLFRDGFETVAQTVSVGSGESVRITEALRADGASSDSSRITGAGPAPRRGKPSGTALVSTAFGLFLLVLAIFEYRDRS